MYRSSSPGDTDNTSPMLSNPYPESSAGNSSRASISNPSLSNVGIRTFAEAGRDHHRGRAASAVRRGSAPPSRRRRMMARRAIAPESRSPALADCSTNGGAREERAGPELGFGRLRRIRRRLDDQRRQVCSVCRRVGRGSDELRSGVSSSPTSHSRAQAPQ